MGRPRKIDVQLKEIQREKLMLQKELVKRMEAGRLYREQNKSFFFKPYKWQNKCDDMVEKKNITIIPAPNKIGKTALVINEAVSWAMGFKPWAEVPADYAGAVEFNKHFYKPSSLGIKPPVKIRITGEDWKAHLGQTIVPELKKWSPLSQYETKKNEVGVEYFWTWKNGSTFELMTYTQETNVSEAWMGHGWIADEPPPQKMYGAMSRGVFLNNGKVILSMTPLKEVWILDELILSGRSDVGVMDGLIITDNEDLYSDEVGKLKEMGLTDSQIALYFDMLLYKDKKKEKFVEDRGKAAKQFVVSNAIIEKTTSVDTLKLLRFVQDTDPQEAPSRFGGKFKALVGRVLKQWNQDIHWIEPFKVPTDWPVIPMIDFHLSKPHAISFHAINRQGVKYIIHEIWENLSSEEVADSIIRYVTANALRCDRAQIDPLSKGDLGYMKNRMGTDMRDSFSVIAERLAEHNIMLEVASKDKTSGIKNIQAELEGVNGVATYYVFNTCARHLFEIQRWVYDDDGDPIKENDHFMENFYRATLSGLEWEDLRPKALPSMVHSSEHAWMAG